MKAGDRQRKLAALSAITAGLLPSVSPLLFSSGVYLYQVQPATGKAYKLFKVSYCPIETCGLVEYQRISRYLDVECANAKFELT